MQYFGVIRLLGLIVIAPTFGIMATVMALAGALAVLVVGSISVGEGLSCDDFNWLWA